MDEHGMRVVVAGSSGLVGTALVAQLRQAGHDVVRLVRRPPAAPDERGWDPPSGHLDDGALDGADAVVNLCGSPQQPRRWTGAYRQAMRDSRVVPTEVLAGAVAERGIPRLLNASGSHFYGDTGPREVDETHPFGGGGLFLGELVRDWEAATAAATEAGARVALLRTSAVLSHSGGLLGVLRPVFSLMLGGRLGSGRQYLSWISLDDHVGAIRHVLEDDTITGPVNHTAPHPVTNAEFTRAMAAAVGRPAPFVVPACAMRAVLGESAEELALISQRIRPRVLSESGFTFVHPRVNAAAAAAVRG